MVFYDIWDLPASYTHHTSRMSCCVETTSDLEMIDNDKVNETNDIDCLKVVDKAGHPTRDVKSRESSDSRR